MNNIWETLNIEPTTDKKIIRKAYSQLVKKYHPEEEPEKYKEIREAYEQALFYAEYSLNDETVIIEHTDYDETVQDDNSFIDNILESADTQHKSMEDLIYQGMVSVIQETFALYAKTPNDLDAWKHFIESNKDHSELILETLFKSSMEAINDERIIAYFKDVIELLPRKDVSLYKKRLQDLESQLDNIRKKIHGHSFLRLLDILGTIIILIALIGCVIGFFVIGFKGMFFSNQFTQNYIFFVILSCICSYFLFYVLNRNLDNKKSFFYRDYRLVGMTLFASLLSVTYIYLLLILLSFVPDVEGLYYIFVAELIIMKVFFSKEKYKNIYQPTKMDLEILALPIVLVYIYCFLVIFIYLLMLYFIRTEVLLYAIFIMILGIFMGTAVANLYNEKKYEGICTKIQSVICWLTNIAYLELVHFSIQIFKNSHNINSELNVAGGFIIVICILVMILYFYVGYKNIARYKKIFKMNYQDAVVEMYSFLCRKSEYGEKMNNLNEYETYFYLVQQLDMEINNGGFHHFYNNELADNIQRIILGLERMRAFNTLEILKKAQAIFSSEYVLVNQEVRQHELGKLMEEEKNMNYLEELSKQFIEYDNELCSLSYQFIMQNKKSFPYKKKD